METETIILSRRLPYQVRDVGKEQRFAAVAGTFEDVAHGSTRLERLMKPEATPRSARSELPRSRSAPVVIAGLTLSAAACYLPTAPLKAPEPITLKTPYDPNADSWADEPGDNTIEGTALLRTVGGEVRTCAALTVSAVPATTYAKERIAHVYKNLNAGFNPAGAGAV